MEATAFARAPEATAAGTEAHEGVVTADPAVPPLGAKIRTTGTTAYDGNYLVTGTGQRSRACTSISMSRRKSRTKQFGTKRVRVQIRQMGTGKAVVRRKDTASH